MEDIQPTPAPVCLDWVFSNCSNVHVAKDRAWFTDYAPFESFVVDIHGLVTDGIPIVGVGTVELPTKRSPNLSGRKSHGILRLTNVLHAPSSLCNIIGDPINSDYSVTIAPGRDASNGSIKTNDGRCVAYFDKERPMFQVKLRNPPVGYHVLQHNSNTIHMINALWPDSERQRWEEYQTCATNVAQPNYTDEEKQWLKDNYRGEFRFLQCHGLSIYKDEDREEGRSIVRAFMRDDKEDADEEEDEDNDSETSLDGHMADHQFAEAELDFIEKNYRNSRLFMERFGLKFYDDNDCDEARSILSSLMASED